jgi:hypothetical protein
MSSLKTVVVCLLLGGCNGSSAVAVVDEMVAATCACESFSCLAEVQGRYQARLEAEARATGSAEDERRILAAMERSRACTAAVLALEEARRAADAVCACADLDCVARARAARRPTAAVAAGRQRTAIADVEKRLAACAAALDAKTATPERKAE